MAARVSTRSKEASTCTASTSGPSFNSVLALNVRTKIAMGLTDDGCASVAWCGDKFSVAGQNWDRHWMYAQKERLVIFYIRPSGASQPAISTVIEAAIVAKTGLNSAVPGSGDSDKQ
ncbi:Serpin domain protein [Metarhizium robertsii ARSEF 23]|uniref:Serpin domain protein n=1 Tax=Metarhizium robertsii (strain ARSEF 23 / ATCC MYA-3075) TaxID=655844 RepID=E9F6J5_METRA|nr:Serpin domain protein [Metarhizium robertsii ARSEF 23]EFY96611.2 Serpin domain protein [Metarhizium robertsii ARSEF 23]